MQDFINLAASQLGISQQQSASATAGVLGVLQQKMPGGEFSSLLGQLPGAKDVLSHATGGAMGSSASSSGGLGGIGNALGGLLGGNKGDQANPLGEIMSAAGGLLGGNKGGGDALGVLTSVLGSSGLSLDKLGPFVGMFMQYVQGKAGQGGLNSILGALPELKKLGL